MVKLNKASLILYYRLIEKISEFSYYEEKFNIDKSEFNSKFKTMKRAKELHSDELIVKFLNLFNSKISSDKNILKWNKKHPFKKAKQLSFTSYSKLDTSGKITSSSNDINNFLSHLEEQYNSQKKMDLKEELFWIADCDYIEHNDCVCYYCGINENILRTLYHDPEGRCKTKRNRGAWFELDRRDSSTDKNLYTKDNMVFCCYFCNNHKSDVISSNDMRRYFGMQFFLFLMHKYESISKI